MPSSSERTPRERETLMFDNQEDAQRFSESVVERVQKDKQPDVNRDREIVAEAVAEQFEQSGESVGMVKTPWEHSPVEHKEAQMLVDLVFTKDLRSAIKQAQESQYYPRNLDLLHDVLTTEMYKLLQQSGLNKQATGLWFISMAIVVLLALIIFVLFLSL